ncbi:MAG: hypothetical protein ABIX01_03565 [Chitinophagaceae bacterium]
MRFICTLLILLAFTNAAPAQNDLLLLRKHNKTVRQFYPGISIQFFTENMQLVNGFITRISHDSLFMNQYDTRTMYTGWGSAVVDTISTYHIAWSYKDIVGFPAKQKFTSATIPSILMIGSAGYAGLNIVNAGLLNQSLTGTENLGKLGIAAGVFGVGYLLKKSKKDYLPIGKKYKLVYLRV